MTVLETWCHVASIVVWITGVIVSTNSWALPLKLPWSSNPSGQYVDFHSSRSQVSLPNAERYKQSQMASRASARRLPQLGLAGSWGQLGVNADTHEAQRRFLRGHVRGEGRLRGFKISCHTRRAAQDSGHAELLADDRAQVDTGEHAAVGQGQSLPCTYVPSAR